VIRRAVLTRLQQKEAATGKQRERQQHEGNVQLVGALNGIAAEQRAVRYQADAHEHRRASRENWTRWGIVATALLALASLIVTLVALLVTHSDTQQALDLAAQANKTAQDTAAAQIKEMAAQSRAAPDSG
jgi:hypothetical protein